VQRIGAEEQRFNAQTKVYDPVQDMRAVGQYLEDQRKAWDRIVKQQRDLLFGTYGERTLYASDKLSRQLAYVNQIVDGKSGLLTATERLRQYATEALQSTDLRTRFTPLPSVQSDVQRLYEQNKRMALEQVAYLSSFGSAATLETLCSTLTQQLKTLQSSNATLAKSVTETVAASLEAFKELQEEKLEGVEERLTTKLDSLPSKLKEPGFWRRIQQLAAIVGILSLALSYVQYLNSKADSEKNAEIAAKLLLLVQQLVEQTKQSPTRRYIVVTPTHLKMNPTNRSKTIAILETNDEIDYLPTGSHKWIQVAYNDGSSEICGWVQKKHLHRMN